MGTLLFKSDSESGDDDIFSSYKNLDKSGKILDGTKSEPIEKPHIQSHSTEKKTEEPIKTEILIVEKPKIKAQDLFDEDSDEDDLFAPTSRTKTAKNTFATSKKIKDDLFDDSDEDPHIFPSAVGQGKKANLFLDDSED